VNPDTFYRMAGVAWLLVAGLFLAGCAREEPKDSPNGWPPVLRLGYTPSEDTVADREEAQRVLAGYLQRTLGVKVEVVRTASYGPAVEAMTRGEIDIMSLGPFAYVLASDKGVAEAVAATGRAGGALRTYQSALITHRRTGLTQIDHLGAWARELRFNYTDPASNSGHLVPQAKLASLGVVAERDFKSAEFTLSHSVSVFNVAFGKADVAGVSNTVLQRLITKGRVPRDDLVMLWVSEPLPLGPVSVRPSLPADLKEAVRRALTELPEKDPAAWRGAMQQYAEPDLVFLACDDSLYDGLRSLAKAVRPTGPE
jgi:phosphonate transport system substrate-binding protein